MKKVINSIITLCLVLFLAISCKSTSTSTSTVKTPVKQEKLANSLLWKISGNGLEKPSYLFGTIHMTCDYRFSDKLKTAFDETQQLALEVDMDDPSMQIKMMKGMMMKDTATIKNMLSADDYKKLNAFFKENVGMGVGMFNKAKPFMLMSMLLAKMTGCQTPQSYEQEFMKIAKAQKEEVVGLETIESQLELFDEIPYKEQLDEVMKLVNEGVEQGQKDFAKLSALHTAENIVGMHTLMLEEESMEKEFSEKLLDNRNSNWIPVIETMAKEKPTLFAVGAMHLAGKKGVISLLKNKGYTVEPVN